ncbi:hypothetical protein [Chryseobacterium herbae]|uniref:Uncharacterized protein n=1 Tax=Chryseobacterium herbae TaxID=2976476 RepID=A0ABT2ITG7_9FLAO|nr:hypothetical protein [Chryseobacterium sp. pc1-10]MCT2561791.1 hypothetical protein [Chryseobacterium sp. pc1-10]
MKYNTTERENWLESIHPDFNKQLFHHDPVLHPCHIIHSDFFTRKEIVSEYISPSKICGLEYAWGYNCPAYKSKEWRMEWIEMIHYLRRLDRVIDNFKTKAEVLAHIHKDNDPKVVKQYGDHYFTTSGQHRLCLAKFLEVGQVKVSVHKYVLNRDLFKREMTLNRYLPKLQELELLFKYYESNLNFDFIGLDTAKDTTYIKKEFVKYLVGRYDELKSSPVKGIKNSLKVYFSNEKISQINDEHDLYKLDPILRKTIYLMNQKNRLSKLKNGHTRN